MKILIVATTFLLTFTVMGCKDESYSTAHPPVLIWNCRDSDEIILVSFRFSLNNENQLLYALDIIENIEYISAVGEFEIIGSIKPFSEWNECNIKFPSDTTKNWLFRFEGKNIPTNISVLWDTKNTSGDTLVFWDSVSNIKYNFKKYIMR